MNTQNGVRRERRQSGTRIGLAAGRLLTACSNEKQGQAEGGEMSKTHVRLFVPEAGLNLKQNPCAGFGVPPSGGRSAPVPGRSNVDRSRALAFFLLTAVWELLPPGMGAL